MNVGQLAGVQVLTASGAPVDGTTGANFATPGSLYINVANGNVYVNSGTKASPTWAVVSVASLSAAELAVLDGVTAGTVAASKAVVVDANKDAGDFRNLDAANIDAGASGTAGTVDVFPATAAKGKLAVTCADQTGNTTVTLNANAMGQATQVNVADPGAAASYVVQSTAAVTLAEADALDGATAGTAVASKAVVLDGSKNHAGISALTLGTIGAAGVVGQLVLSDGANPGYKATVQTDAQTANLTIHTPDPGAMVDAYVALSTAALTAAEVDVLDGATVGVPVASKALIAPAALGNGAVAGTGATVSEQGNAVIHKTVITFTNVDVPLTDAAGVVAYGGLKVYDMPAGAILFLGAVADIDLTKSSAGVNADWDGDVGIGTVTAAADATLAGTEQNIIPTTATPQAVAGVTTANAQSTATENAVVNGTSAAVDVYVNLLVDDLDHDVATTPCNLILNGTLTLHWINLGDY